MARTRRRNKISKIEMRGEIGFKIEPRDNEIITITNALQITVPISGDRVPNKIQVRRNKFGPATVRCLDLLVDNHGLVYFWGSNGHALTSWSHPFVGV